MPRVVDFYTRVGADERLFAKYKAVLADPGSARLSAPRQRALNNSIRDFKLSGAELEGAAKTRHAHAGHRRVQADLADDQRDQHRCRARGRPLRVSH